MRGNWAGWIYGLFSPLIKAGLERSLFEYCVDTSRQLRTGGEQSGEMGILEEEPLFIMAPLVNSSHLQLHA